MGLRAKLHFKLVSQKLMLKKIDMNYCVMCVTVDVLKFRKYISCVSHLRNFNNNVIVKNVSDEEQNIVVGSIVNAV